MGKVFRDRFPEDGDEEIRYCRDAISWGGGVRSGWVDDLVVWKQITEFVDRVFRSTEDVLSVETVDRIERQLEFDGDELLDLAKRWPGSLREKARAIASMSEASEVVAELIALESAAKTEAEETEYELGLDLLRGSLRYWLVDAAEQLGGEYDELSGFSIPELVGFIRERGGVMTTGGKDGLCINDHEASAWVSLHTVGYDDWAGIVVDLTSGLTEKGERVFDIEEAA